MQKKSKPMPNEPSIKRVMAFVDGQNLFHSARKSFGYTYPNYDPLALAKSICSRQKLWELYGVRFYTGIPTRVHNEQWNEFWAQKLSVMGKLGIWTYSRSLRYRMKKIQLSDKSTIDHLEAEEKGIDVRIAIDIISMARKDAYDIALVFSQDQDFMEAAKEIRQISNEKKRWIKMASAFPSSTTSTNKRGINQTDWIPFEKAAYDRCLDERDYSKFKTPALHSTAHSS